MDSVTQPDTGEKPKSEQASPVRQIFVPRWMRDGLIADLKGARLAVWLVYCSHSNSQGEAWPSIGALARETGYDAGTVKLARRELIDMGLLTKIRQERGEHGEFGRSVFSVSLHRSTKTDPRHRVRVNRRRSNRPTVEPTAVKQPSKVSPSPKVPDGEGSRQHFLHEGDSGSSQKVPPSGTADCRSPHKRKKTADENHFAKAILAGSGNGPYAQSVGDEMPKLTQPALEFSKCVGFDLDLDSPLVSRNFVDALGHVWKRWGKDGLHRPGILCSKVIDLCVDSEEFKTHYPPEFQDLRDRLRKAERGEDQEEAEQ